GVAALVQVVDDGDEAVERLGEVVVARLAVDEGVGGVPGPLEAHRAFVLVDPEIGQRPPDPLRLAQVLDDLQLRDLLRSIGVGAQDPAPSTAAVVALPSWSHLRSRCPWAGTCRSAPPKNQSGWLSVMPVTLKNRTAARPNIDT